MQEKRNLHLKVQEMCDCYATTDPLKELSDMSGQTADLKEAAAKWLALAALHGVNDGAEKITISRNGAGKVKVTATYRTATLPAPDKEVAQEVIGAVREITHIEEKKGKLPLSLGIRGGSVDIMVKVKSGEGKEKVSLKFIE